MILRKIYEKVNLVVPLEERRFFNYFEDSVEELEAAYSGFVIKNGMEYIPPITLDDFNAVRDLYSDAIVDNIIFMATKEEYYKSEFLRKAKTAYLKYWTDNAKGRHVRRYGW